MSARIHINVPFSPEHKKDIDQQAEKNGRTPTGEVRFGYLEYLKKVKADKTLTAIKKAKSKHE